MSWRLSHIFRTPIRALSSMRELRIRTKCPEKYVLVDTQSGNVYRGNNDHEGFDWVKLSCTKRMVETREIIRQYEHAAVLERTIHSVPTFAGSTGCPVVVTVCEDHGDSKTYVTMVARRSPSKSNWELIDDCGQIYHTNVPVLVDGIVVHVGPAAQGVENV